MKDAHWKIGILVLLVLILGLLSYLIYWLTGDMKTTKARISELDKQLKAQ